MLKFRRIEMKPMQALKLAALLSGLLCMGLIIAVDASAAAKNPCDRDIAKYCKNVKAEKGALMDCLEQNESKLSQACRMYEEKMGGKRVEIREQIRERVRVRRACRDDMSRFCTNEDLKTGYTKCLFAHEAELSAPCGETIRALRQSGE
jgi:hypothetical protein